LNALKSKMSESIHVMKWEEMSLVYWDVRQLSY